MKSPAEFCVKSSEITELSTDFFRIHRHSLRDWFLLKNPFSFIWSTISILKYNVSAICFFSLFLEVAAQVPVNPNASPEARALLDLIYNISGKYTLTGQHNFPASGSRNSHFVTWYSGQTPVIWSTDMGFAREGDKDSYLSRPQIVKEAIRQHRKGSLVTICWHAVPPTADEPVTFQPAGPHHRDSLASVQGQLTDRQFQELLTPGTVLFAKWAAQVDTIAFYLKQLQDAHVPVLWRPYHEMNGDWFWWGGRTGKYSTAQLYRQLFDRMVHFHKLNNLIWVWNVDRPTTPVRKFSNFYPGNQYLDILSLDVYGSDFKKAYYDSLLALSEGKPIALGEVGNPPSVEVLRDQPKWAYWVIWAGMAQNLSRPQYCGLVNVPDILSREDHAWSEVSAAFRRTCNLSPLPVKEFYLPDYTGHWKLNEEKSSFDDTGAGNVSYLLFIDHDEEVLRVQKLVLSEFENHQVTLEEYILDGTERQTVVLNSSYITKAVWDKESCGPVITSQVTYTEGRNKFMTKKTETWSFSGDGNTLTIRQISTGFRGKETHLVLVYNRIDSNCPVQ